MNVLSALRCPLSPSSLPLQIPHLDFLRRFVIRSAGVPAGRSVAPAGGARPLKEMNEHESEGY